MATRQLTAAGPGIGQDIEHAVLITWTGLLNGDDGSSATFHDYPDRTVQFTGIFGTGGSVQIEGSNNGVDWAVLTDPQGNNIVKTAAGMEMVSETPRFVRPRVTAGDGTTNIVVTMFARTPR